MKGASSPLDVSELIGAGGFTDGLHRLLRERYNATGFHLVQTKGENVIDRHAIVGFDPQVVYEWDAHYGHVHPFNTEFGGVKNKIVDDSDFITPKAMAQNEFYDWAGRFDGYFRIGGLLDRNEGATLSVWMLRAKQFGPATRAEKHAFAQLLPEIRAALTQEQRLRGAISGPTGGADSFVHRSPAPMALIAANLDILTMNVPATRITAEDDGVRDRGGSLEIWSDTARRRLAQAIKSNATVEIALHRPSKRRPYRAVISPLSLEWFLSKGSVAVYLLTLSDPQSAEKAATRFVAREYGLSEIETEILEALVEGRAVDAIALERKRSIETIRGQIKSIQKKTGLKRLAQLVAFVRRY